jgi:hypothetical protein
MMKIDLSGPAGNVFCLLGYAKSIKKQLAASGTSNTEIDEVLTGFTNMEYSDIVAKLEKSGFFDFGSDDDDADTCSECGLDTCDCECDS